MHNLPMHIPAPPRDVPISLRILHRCNGVALTGWAVFGFGMLFFWAFAGNADYSFLTFRNATGRAIGKVTQVQDTGSSVNDREVVASHYQFSVAGQSYDGRSYTTESTPSEGDAVTIEFDEGNPGRSRITGMRRAPFGPAAMVVSIFPLVGLAFLIGGTRWGGKRTHLLRHGVFTTAKPIGKEPTNVTINKRPVWEVRYEFVDRNGQRREATARATDTTKLEDEAREPMLYDPEDPNRSCVLDEGPGRPRFENGQLLARPLPAFFALILPTIVLAANLFVLWLKLRPVS